jgi:ribosomal protein S18 acetylase RimI-like enzyme
MMPSTTLPAILRHGVRHEDVEAVHQLVLATGFFNEEETTVAAELVQASLEQGEASGYFFIFAERDDRLAGYVCYGPIPGTTGSYYIYWVVVAPSWQNCGLGRQLINECEHDIRQRRGRRIYVETAGREQYVPTRAFYERLGYYPVACLPEFYAMGDAKVIYEKVLLR